MRTTTETLQGLTITNLWVDAPLAADEPNGRTIEVYARVITGDGGAGKPYLVFLQGGPGGEAPRPSVVPSSPPWLKPALRDYQVIMLDQRGTGLSTPVSSRYVRDEQGTRVEVAGALAGLTPQQQADHITHLRADEIVNDCELIRQELGADKLTLFGQSFGGFTSLNYLSRFPSSLAGAIITGGLSAVGRPVDDVYALTWQIMMRRSDEYYARFPGDRDRMRALSDLCAQGRIALPNGDVVSPDRLRTIGHRIGMQGGAEQLHYLLERDPFSSAFAHDLMASMPFRGRNPLYAVFHESSYADGGATRWSADRTMPQAVKDDPTLLGAEHLHASLFDEDSELAAFREVAHILAEHEWPRMYDEAALAAADVPIAAAVYVNDPYVPLEFSLETANLLPDCRAWVTSEYEHNGLWMGEGVFTHLDDLLHGRRWL